MYHRFFLYISIVVVVSLLLLIGLYQSPWTYDHESHLSDYLSALKDNDNSTTIKNSKTSSIEEPLNNTYPHTTLVLATLSSDDNTWIENELSDLLGPSTNLYTALYVVDSTTAPLHTPANKGHEAMAYLTYLIDFYDTLPEISLFLHGHPSAWHNNYLLNMSTSQIIRHLSREKVLRDGYFNLRCHWSPGCPTHLHPQETKYDSTKTEELHIAGVWAELFPNDPLPQDLSQPCCSQFAVSRATIHRHPVEKYILFRDWLLSTPLSDYITGRIFEYFWQYIFLSAPSFCPDPRICYCDGYGICFVDPGAYAGFFELVTEMERLRKESEAWGRFREGKLIGERADRDMDEGPDPVLEGGETREVWLEGKIGEIEEELARRKEEAFEVGRDPVRREEAIAAARNQTLELGDLKDGPPFWK